MSVIKKYLFTFLLFAFAFTIPVYAESKMGAVAKLPFPLGGENVSLESQKVKIIVYSDFIEVDGEYIIKNNNKEDITAAIGFPMHHRSIETQRGESHALNFKAYTGKKDEDYFVKRKVDGSISSTVDSAYTIWYQWDMDIRGGRTARVKVHYYLKMDRERGVPNFTYEISRAKNYKGSIKSSDILVNLPIDARNLSAVSSKDYRDGSFLYTSLSQPKINRNILSWKIDDMETSEDLEVYFYGSGYPGWEITCSSSDGEGGNTCKNLIDGSPYTYWASAADRRGEGSWFEFKPFVEKNGVKSYTFEPVIHKIAIIPGNGESLSSFYQYSHLREAELEIKAEKSDEDENQDDTRAKRIRSRQQDIIDIYCTADWSLQEFETRKVPLDTKSGPARLTVKSIYPGQKYNTLCISEILIFDRKENEVYDTY